MKRVVLLLFSCFLLLSGAAVGATGIGGRPANPQPDNPRTQSIFIYKLEPSAQAEDQIIVANNTDKKATIELYATDGTTTNNGGFACKQRVEPHKDIGNWVNFSVPSVTLEPHMSTKVPFIVTVPKEVSEGEHTGCIVLQEAAAGSNQGVNNGVNLQVRSAVRIVALLPGNLKKDIRIEDFQVQAGGGSHRYDFTLLNKGNVSTDVRASVVLKNVLGDTVRQASDEYPVLREGKLRVAFDVDDPPLWGGLYVATARAEYDARPYKFGISGSGPLSATESDKKIVFIWPHPLVLLLIIAGIAILIYFYMRRNEGGGEQKKYRLVTAQEIKERPVVSIPHESKQEP